jgi:DinB superfamily
MQRVLNRLDSTHSKLLATVTSLADDTFSQRPSESQWSVAEILNHLYLVEERVIKDLKKALESAPRKPSLMKRFVPTVIVASRAIRVKSPKAVVPISPQKKEGTIEAYNQARSRLKELCSTYGAARLEETTFKHPFLGEISGVATISFVGYHEQRHFKQIREVLKKLKKWS